MLVTESELLRQIEEAARGAGEIMRSAHREDLHVRSKAGRTNFVTQYDSQVQNFLVGRLGEILPEAAFLGEEDGRDLFRPEYEQGYLFVIDPIDGTTNFMHDLPPYVTSIGLLKDGQPYAAVIYCPETDQLFSALAGGGACENGRPIHSSEQPLSDSIALCGTSGYNLDSAAKARRIEYAYQHLCQGVRSMGCAEYALAMVASGRAGLYQELEIQIWDYAAGGLLLMEAGGRITDMEGAPLSFRGGSSVLAVSAGVARDVQRVAEPMEMK